MDELLFGTLYGLTAPTFEADDGAGGAGGGAGEGGEGSGGDGAGSSGGDAQAGADAAKELAEARKEIEKLRREAAANRVKAKTAGEAAERSVADRIQALEERAVKAERTAALAGKVSNVALAMRVAADYVGEDGAVDVERMLKDFPELKPSAAGAGDDTKKRGLPGAPGGAPRTGDAAPKSLRDAVAQSLQGGK